MAGSFLAGDYGAVRTVVGLLPGIVANSTSSSGVFRALVSVACT